MNINFSGYNENVVTFETNSNDVIMGTPVKMASSGTVAKCSASDEFCGVAVNVRNGYSAVQLSGYIEMPTDDTFAVGYQNICAGDNGKVKSATSGREYLVVYVSNGIVGFIL